MKLGEALRQRSDLYARINELTSRASSNAVIQEGDDVSENVHDLLKEIQSLHEQAYKLVQRINRTNNLTTLPNRMILADALAYRDYLKAVQNSYRTINNEVANDRSSFRYSRSEIKTVKTITSKEILDTVDKYAKEFRELDVLIQAENWQADLSD